MSEDLITSLNLSDPLEELNVDSSSNLNAAKLQRKQRLEAVVQKRSMNLGYLKKVHENNSYWFNIVLLKKEVSNDLLESLNITA